MKAESLPTTFDDGGQMNAEAQPNDDEPSGFRRGFLRLMPVLCFVGMSDGGCRSWFAASGGCFNQHRGTDRHVGAVANCG